MNWEQVVIYKTGEVANLMNERGIREDDVKKVIFEAEKSGRKLHQEINDRFLAKGVLDNFTVYAEYSRKDDGFEIHSAYSHRICIESDIRN